jgi:hypothetical protein
MNTTIVTWVDGKRNFDLPALWFFLYTVGPMTVVVFFLWWVFSRWMKREAKIARDKRQKDTDMILTEKSV